MVYYIGMQRNATKQNAPNGTENMKTFKVGQAYSTRSTCDHECIFAITVSKRTAKTITTAAGKTLRIAKKDSDYNKAETVLPFGRYSMCASIHA